MVLAGMLKHGKRDDLIEFGKLFAFFVKNKLDVGLLVVMIWLELCTTYSSSSPVVTATSIVLYFNRHWLTQVDLENGH